MSFANFDEIYAICCESEKGELLEEEKLLSHEGIFPEKVLKNGEDPLLTEADEKLLVV
ncbi:hypothetical protein [Effusibacillus consociatus]|uniref:Uncharacterized protein n=1 Tax=Effusibacillus consociatus TaxID=1117041 RepID=A0ABV9PY04_9BACL